MPNNKPTNPGRSKNSPILILSATTIALLLCLSSARAVISPDPATSTYPNPAVSNGGTTTLDLNPLSYRVAGNCPWVQPALTAEGFSAANGWTINLVALTATATITRGTYGPWADIDPNFSQGAFLNQHYDDVLGAGGVNIGLGYSPGGAADPRGTNNWIQVIHTKDPSGFGIANGVNEGNGYTDYIDNGYRATVQNPFYGGTNNSAGAYLGNATDFLDIPLRNLTPGTDWQAQVFVATWKPNNALDVTKGGSITLYDGVWYGFNTVPEPGALSIIGVGLIIACRRIRQR